MPTDSFWVFRGAVGSHQKEIGINIKHYFIKLTISFKPL